MFGQVAHGRLDKQIASDFGIREVTVKLHRSNMMRKLELRSASQLVRVWETLPESLPHIHIT